uniref:Uncharacterized protein n=1 Tax=Trypanosoma congolense (strain IL3000) TaxID=1068625 RepID=G0UUU3_TRYCI|nr:conserved hypothetical protein [Trypanosoma congolense IL3000]
MDSSQCTTRSLVQLVGDCELVFKHPVSYEPPMYLFPELLPRVAEGTAPVAVGDAVADALDVEASSLNIAELFHLPSEDLRKGNGGVNDGDGYDVSDESKSDAVATTVTLGSLIASNRLQSIGLSPEILQRGKFSSGAIIEELSKLVNRIGLNADEAKTIMSNHFINVLAWRAAVDINSCRLPTKRGREDGDDNECVSTTNRGDRSSCNGNSADSVDVQALQPSVDPWSTDIDLQPGTFVAASESGVEERIDLLSNLTKLYRRPWRTLQSRGMQTDLCTPGVINLTSPYADPAKLPGASLDSVEDLGWKAEALNTCEGWGWVVQVASTSTTHTQAIPLRHRVTNFGRCAGVTQSTSCGVTNVHIGLSPFTKNQNFVSPHHFSLVLLPERSHSTEASGNSQERREEASAGEGETSTSDSLWLMSYGRNGVRVEGKQWSLGNMIRLDVGDVLYPTHDTRVTITRSGNSSEPQQEGVVEDAVAIKKEPEISMIE